MKRTYKIIFAALLLTTVAVAEPDWKSLYSSPEAVVVSLERAACSYATEDCPVLVRYNALPVVGAPKGIQPESWTETHLVDREVLKLLDKSCVLDDANRPKVFAQKKKACAQ